MKHELVGLSQRYVTTWQTHLKRGPRSNLEPALRPGRQAVALGPETLERPASQRQLKRGVVRYKVSKNAFETGGTPRHKCLEESLQLQNRLWQSPHRALGAPEDECYQISHGLRDEIAPTLPGIKVWLLSLKQAARSDSNALKNAIASALRPVIKSAKSVRRFARHLDTPHPNPGARSVMTL